MYILLQEHEQKSPKDHDEAAESSILPILGSVGSVGKKASIKSLRYPILKELHGIAPLRYASGPSSWSYMYSTTL